MTHIADRQVPTHFITLAGMAHLEPLSYLLNAHRIEQGLPDNQPAVAHFLFERLINHESVQFIALSTSPELSGPQSLSTGSQGLGFVQIYPSFSSESLMPFWNLGAWYVTPAARQQGLGKALIEQALTLIRERGDEGLRANLLSNHTRHTSARKLLQDIGFQAQPGLERLAYRIITPLA